MIKIQKFEEYLTGTGLAFVFFYFGMLMRYPQDFLKPSVIFIIVPLVFFVTLITEILIHSLNKRLTKDSSLYISLGISMLLFLLFKATGFSTFLGATAYFYGRKLSQTWLTIVIQFIPIVMFVGSLFIIHINK